ncbi:MAG: hypothetical protein CMF61_04595 [Magnetococcales bacterium]|nr:hypothetical protein [Magnetococcales bacterium]
MPNSKHVLNNHKLNQSLSSMIWITFAIFAGLFFLNLNLTGLFDVDEAIFAEASYEMLETGDYVTPQYNGEPRYHKPPLIYWVQSISMDLLGKTPLAARLPSAVFAFLTVFGFYAFISGMTGNKRLAITASIILGANLSFLVISQASTADMALNFFVVMATMGLIANLYAKQRSKVAPLFVGVVLGLAMLAKGPVSLVVPAFVVGLAVLFKPNFIYNLKCVNPFYVLLAMLITLVPWVQFVIDAKGFDFFHEFIVVHNIERFTKGMGNTQSSSHFYYVFVLMIGFFPWVLLLPNAIRTAVSGFKRRLASEDVEKALPALGFLWFVVIFVLFSFSATKLPHYILPSYAGAALMIAYRLEKMWDKPLRSYSWVWALPIVVLFSVVFLLFKYVPDIALGRIDQLPSLLQSLMHYLQNSHGIEIKDVEAQTKFVLEQDVHISSLTFALGVLTLIGVPLGLFYIYARNRAGVIILMAVNFMVLLLVAVSVVPVVYKFIQQPLANIGTEIKQEFNTEKDKLYFVAIHQPSVRFVSGVPFKNLNAPKELLNEVMPEEDATLWFVFKQEKLDAMQEIAPKYACQTSCEGGYCLVKMTMDNMRRHLQQR